MRHRLAGRKLGRTSSHRLALLRNMAVSLFRHERVTTTVQKAKELRSFSERLITLAKDESLHNRRQVMRHIKDREIVTKLFSVLGVRYATRPGGYTRIIRTGFRRGDSAEMAVIELVDSSVEIAAPKKKAAPAKKKTAPPKAGPRRRPGRKGTAREEALADVTAAEEAAMAPQAEEEEAEEEKEEAQDTAEPKEKKKKKKGKKADSEDETDEGRGED